MPGVTVTAGGCWLWQGHRDRHGYGVRGGRLAHRVAWELARGPIPAGLSVCHHCDEPACVNPEHLFVATHAENMADRGRKGRAARGERNGRAKLTAEQAAAIRARAGESHRSLAREFGVDRTTVRDIVRGVIWRGL